MGRDGLVLAGAAHDVNGIDALAPAEPILDSPLLPGGLETVPSLEEADVGGRDGDGLQGRGDLGFNLLMGWDAPHQGYEEKEKKQDAHREPPE